MEHMNHLYNEVGIYSVYASDLDPDIAIYQKKVFDKLNININQIIYDKTNCFNDHGRLLTEISRNFKNDFFIFFDVDCIPLNDKFYNILLQYIKKDILSGAIASANHILPDNLYVHPCFFGFSKKLYIECNEPNLEEYENGDVAQIFTDICVTNGYPIKYWNITNGGDNCWDLPDDGGKFGHGTIYDNMIYHQFEIRSESQHDGFINKCKTILNE